jgi:signal transduction histidine kinase
MSQNPLSLEQNAELRRMALQLARVVEISVTLNSTLELDQLLRFILDTAAALLECEAVSIMLYDEKEEKLFIAAATNTQPGELENIPIPLEGSIAGTILRANRPITVNDVDKDPRHYSNVSDQVQFAVRSLVGVPMAIQNRVTGVLEALNKRAGGFGDQDAELLSIIASQAAVAINNARLLQALQEANEELNKVDKLKSDFMAVASHELRTPLGIILGYATFLKEEAQGELSEHANSVLNAAVRLQTLVEDMTNMNLLYTKKADLQQKPVILQEIIHRAYMNVVSAAEAKHDILKINLPREKIIVNADPKLILVFVNVLNNAIRFTPDQGKIYLQLKKENDKAVVEITDNGIGIPKDKLDRIFDQFFQVEDHMTRKFGGLGLGLAIARAFAELHDGKIWAESDGPGKGATFKIVLPIVK